MTKIVQVINEAAIKEGNGGTHYEGCWKSHKMCMALVAALDILALESALRIAAGLVSTIPGFSDKEPEALYDALLQLGIMEMTSEEEITNEESE